ncbi:MAG: tol-pal system-associated acyl-CoA thioesterase [Xanthomonadales bacterium]|nr:tol-pal system-associated acyl-CoA thioesterase [Xanthomonadales bacterium]
MTEPIPQAHVWQVRVYWEDTDAGGVVYHARYLNFFERARTEWLRAHGIEQSKLAEQDNRVFAITRMEIDFLKAAKLDDELDVSVHSVARNGARLEFDQEMKRRADGKMLCRARVTAVCLEADSFRPARMPGWIKDKINNAEAMHNGK